MVIGRLGEVPDSIEIAVVGRVDQGIFDPFHLISNLEITIFRQTIGYPRSLRFRKPLRHHWVMFCTEYLIRYRPIAKQGTVPTRRSTVAAVGTIIGFQVIGLTIEFATASQLACYRTNIRPIFRLRLHSPLKRSKPRIRSNRSSLSGVTYLKSSPHRSWQIIGSLIIFEAISLNLLILPFPKHIFDIVSSELLSPLSVSIGNKFQEETLHFYRN